MSLMIDIDRVTSVLIANQWFEISDESFDLDAYEFVQDDRIIMGGGNVDGVPSTGFTFTTTDGNVLAGPVTAIQAVRYTKA